MPELPEVETIAAALRNGTNNQPSLCEMAIVGGRVLWPRTLEMPSLDEFKRRIAGQVIEDIGRRGKFLIIQLSQDYLLFHLRMSGDMLLETDEVKEASHPRLVIILENGLHLVFNDPRKFGRVWLVQDLIVVTSSLGLEPLDDAFTSDVLYTMLQKRHRQLKPLLLDQSFIAGLGNIYTDEALHMAGLHPRELSNRVNASQAERLWQSIRSVLQEGIKRNGASIDWVYRGGDFQNYFRVYQRTGEPCPVCGTAVERILVGQRGTHFCPRCQPVPP